MSKPYYVIRDKRWYVDWGKVRYGFRNQGNAEEFYEKHKDEM